MYQSEHYTLPQYDTHGPLLMVMTRLRPLKFSTQTNPIDKGHTRKEPQIFMKVTGEGVSISSVRDSDAKKQVTEVEVRECIVPQHVGAGAV